MRVVLIITLFTIISVGCRPTKNATTATKESSQFPEGALTVPTILSLNNADVAPFCITVKEGKRYTSFKVTIYNRWGQKVWSADKQSACWDGTMDVNKEKTTVAQGVYYLLIEATTSDNQNYKHTATLTVV